MTLYSDAAHLYDLAFSWDVSAEVDWLLERFGEECAPVLEPACGSGRLLAGFGRRGIEAVGIDNAPAMVRLANERLQRERLPAVAVVAEMSDFALDRQFGGAFCAVDSLAYLQERAQLVRHLECVAQHLRAGSRYLVQLDLRDPDHPWQEVRASAWESERDGVRVRTTWRVEDIDLENGVELHRARIDCLSGHEAGRVLEEVHHMAAWTPERWARAIAATPFAYHAVYDGNEASRPQREVGTSGRLLWHELALAP